MDAAMEEYRLKVTAILDKLLQEHPQHSKLTEVMRNRLTQCGWKEAVKVECNKAIQKQGFDNMELDSLIKQVVPKARAAVPAELKIELVAMLREALLKELHQKSIY